MKRKNSRINQSECRISHRWPVIGLETLSKLIEEDNCVISTGGGIVLREENRALLKKGTAIYLKTSIQSQLERTMNDKDRPLLQNTDNKEETLKEMAKLRNPIYETCSEIIIEETNSPNETVDKIIKELKLIQWKK